MTARELAEMMDSRTYGSEITYAEIEEAKESGLVIVFGASDDLMEIRGAIDGEVDCYEGGSVLLDLDKRAIFNPAQDCDCDNENCPLRLEKEAKCSEITAIWCGENDSSWSYETDIEHETFQIIDDGELYCIGIVFALDDLEG